MAEAFDDGGGVEVAVGSEDGFAGEGAGDFGGGDSSDGEGDRGGTGASGWRAVAADAIDGGQAFPEAGEEGVATGVEGGHRGHKALAATPHPGPLPIGWGEGEARVEGGEEINCGGAADDAFVVLGPGFEAVGD